MLNQLYRIINNTVGKQREILIILNAMVLRKIIIIL